ncbi:MAG: hypothetical protein ABIJ92_04345 [Candidatus Aenigmatarchaeota archaeon]
MTLCYLIYGSCIVYTADPIPFSGLDIITGSDTEQTWNEEFALHSHNPTPDRLRVVAVVAMTTESRIERMAELPAPLVWEPGGRATYSLRDGRDLRMKTVPSTSLSATGLSSRLAHVG